MSEQRDQAARVARSIDDSILAGVAGGLGERFGVSAWWFRVAFAVLAVFGFLGVLLYVMAWILIPKETEDDSVATTWIEGLDLTDIGTIVGVVLIGVAVIIILNQLFHVSGGLVAAGVLTIVGVLLYRGDLRPPEKLQVGRQNLNADDAPVGADTATSPDAPSVVTAAAPSVVTRPRREKVKKPRPPKSMLGQLTMAVALIALSSMVLIDLAGWAYFQPVEYLAGSMGIIALGLLIGAWIGRARWLIVIGILLAPWLFFAPLLPAVDEWTFGDPRYEPTSVDQVQDSYSIGGGQLTIDLSGLSAEELAEIGRIEASVSAGNLFVIIPLGVGVVVNTDVVAGSVDVGVEYHEVYGVPSQGVIEEFEACLEHGFGEHECQDRFLNDGSFSGTEIPYVEYDWDEWRSFSGVGISRSFDLGVPPRDFVLDLWVGAGGINITQLGEYDADDRSGG